ncbi:MAG: hypothetical protein QNJ38_24890 [Prochloraceae cyanobacterium]|nr:hypothetical protein [Prochloraceae cyanobacterium]
MSNEIEIKEALILDAIRNLNTDLTGKIEKLTTKIDKVEADVTEIKSEQKVIKAELEGTRKELKAEINQIDKRLGSLEARSNMQVTWFLTVLSLLIGGILTLFTKVVFFPS